MKGRYNKFLCLLMAMIILFTGMCVKPADADSFLACMDNLSSTSYLSSQEGTLSKYELSTREVMGIRDFAFVSDNVKRPTARNIIPLSLFFILAEAHPAKSSDIQTAVETMSAPETHSVTALLNYIHSQDGEK